MDDLISRQVAIDALHMHLMYRMGTDSNKKRLDDWINSLPSVQPKKRTEERTETHACDLIDRQAAIDALDTIHYTDREDWWAVLSTVENLPTVQPESCEGCKHLGKWENEVEYGYPSPCTRCKRRAEDHYER